MTDKKHYTTLESEIAAVSDKEMYNLHIPVETYVKEAGDLLDWVKEDKAEFQKINFDWSIVEGMGQRIGALRHAENSWVSCRRLQRAAQKSFLEQRDRTEQLLHEIIPAMHYVFSEHDDLIQTLRDIRGGRTNADVVMDTGAVRELGLKQKELLEKINFDLGKLDEVADAGRVLSELLSASSTEKLKNFPERIMRDKAYTCLKKSVDTIRRCGKYVFRNNESRLKGYVSHYFRTINRRRKNREKETEAVTA